MPGFLLFSSGRGPVDNILVQRLKEEPNSQRGYMIANGEKRDHCIA